MPRERDPLWEYITKVGGTKVKCNFCQEMFVGGITRMRYHFSKITCKDIRPCPNVTDPIRDLALKGVHDLESKNKKTKISGFWNPSGSSSGSIAQESLISQEATQVTQPQSGIQRTINAMIKKAEKEEADKSLVRCMVNDNLAFNLLRSPSFHEAIRAIAKVRPGYEPPSSELARTTLLEDLKGEANEYVQGMRQSWETCGCTVMSDGWTDGRNRPYLNLLVSCPKGVVFLKSLCTVGNKKDALYIYNFISSVIEDIGPNNVIQFISDNASNYLAAGNMIVDKYKHIFKTSCAAHCINLMFKEFDALESVAPILHSARRVAKFMYRYQHVLDLMRTHTGGRELKRPGATRFATQFICLQSILEQEQSLRYMVASSEWRELAPCKSLEGMEIQNLFQGNEFWDCGRQLIRVMEPLFRILRMVDGDSSSSGYIYYGIRKAKEAIKLIFNEDSAKYLPFWTIIDERWKKSLYCDMYAAAFYLNPHLFYDGHAKMDTDVRNGLEKVILKMLAYNERINIVRELKDYHSKDPSIFGEMAIGSLHVAHPRLWWDMWGSAVPILQKLAIRILSQTCSSSACERNWSAFDAAYTKKRNRLDPTRLQDLVYVRVNNHLKRTMQKKEQLDSTPINLEKLNCNIADIFYGDGGACIQDDRIRGNYDDENDDHGDEDDRGNDDENAVELDFLNATDISPSGVP